MESNMGINGWDGVLVKPGWNVQSMIASLQKDDKEAYNYINGLDKITGVFEKINTVLRATEDGFLPELIESIQETCQDRVLRVFTKEKKNTTGQADMDFVKTIGKSLAVFCFNVIKVGAVIGGLKTLIPAGVIGVLVWVKRRAEAQQLAQNTELSKKLIERLNHCRDLPAKKVLANRERLQAISDRTFQFGQRDFLVIGKVTSENRSYTITKNDLDFIQAIMHKLGIKDLRNGGMNFNSTLSVGRTAGAICVACWETMPQLRKLGITHVDEIIKANGPQLKMAINDVITEGDWSDDIDEGVRASEGVVYVA